MRGLGFLLLLGAAFAASFAAFSVEPAGDQVVDLTTGVTTLPEGGRLVDAERGIALEADWIEYKEGAFVRARGARLAHGDLRFEAGEIVYTAEEERVELGGGVRFSSRELKGLSAERGVLYLKDRVAVLLGGVEGEAPRLRARALVADLDEGLVLLLGPFRYEDPELGLVFEGKGEDATLLLRFVEGGVEVETEVPPELKARLLAYLGS